MLNSPNYLLIFMNEEIQKLEFDFAQDLIFKVFQSPLDTLTEENYKKVTYYFNILPFDSQISLISRMRDFNLTQKHFLHFVRLINFSHLFEENINERTQEQRKSASGIIKIIDCLSRFEDKTLLNEFLFNFNQKFSIDKFLSQYSYRFPTLTKSHCVDVAIDLIQSQYIQNIDVKYQLISEVFKQNIIRQYDFGVFDFFDELRKRQAQVTYVHQNYYNQISKLIDLMPHNEQEEYLKKGKLLNQLIPFLTTFNKVSSDNYFNETTILRFKDAIIQHCLDYDMTEQVILKEVVYPVYLYYTQLIKSVCVSYHDKLSLMSPIQEFNQARKLITQLFNINLPDEIEVHFNQVDYEKTLIVSIESQLDKVNIEMSLSNKNKHAQKIKI